MGTHYSKYQNLIRLDAFYAFNIVWLLEKLASTKDCCSTIATNISITSQR